ncbi:MAG: hypothetical protein PHV36_10655 [Elusimicrobiales bacterium]|nr:hypothetical protein [Elusimicrobiales bacterium]
MKVNSLSFPHPILGSNDDMTGSYEIDGPHVSRAVDKIKITIGHVLRNLDIQYYLDNGDAEFMVEICCPKTFFRKAYFSSTTSHTIEIPENLLRDQVLVDFYAVARRGIRDFHPKTAHNDYGVYKFNLNKGDVLAYAGNTQFSAPKQWLASDAVGNFMEIIDGRFRTGPMKIELSCEKISIQLSTTDYDAYSLLQKSGRFDNLFHSAIVLPALLYAVVQFIEAEEQFEVFAWASVLKDKRQNDAVLSKSVWSAENAPTIAQQILGNPVNRMFVTITEIAENCNG